MGWNEIEQRKNLPFKTINDYEMIEWLLNERNAHDLNQANGLRLQWNRYFYSSEKIVSLQFLKT